MIVILLSFGVNIALPGFAAAKDDIKIMTRGPGVGLALDPRTGRPGARWRQVSVIAPEAARADGLSTAFCLMEEPDIHRASAGLQVDLLR